MKKSLLQEQYKRLFKGRFSSNDAVLLRENANSEVAKVYDVIYSLTDEHGDEPLEVMNQYVDQEGLTAALDKYLDNKKLSSKESKELTAVLNDVAAEFGVDPKTATPVSSNKPSHQKGFDQAFDIKQLKSIKYILPSRDRVDAMFKKGDEFEIKFNNNADLAKIVADFQKIQRKEKSVDAMDVSIFDPDHGEGEIEVRVEDGNYAGLTYLFAAFDDYYGKFGTSMGWS